MRGPRGWAGGTGLRRLAFSLVLALLLAPGPAAALALVDSYRVTWHDRPAGPVVFEDDFAGPTFDSPSYVQTCGTVQPGDQAGGSLTLQRSSPGGLCNDFLQVIAVANALPGAMTVEADYAIGAVDVGTFRGRQLSVGVQPPPGEPGRCRPCRRARRVRRRMPVWRCGRRREGNAPGQHPDRQPCCRRAGRRARPELK